VTLGLLAVSATSGALLGYGVRARQGRGEQHLPGAPAEQARVLPGEKLVGGDKPE